MEGGDLALDGFQPRVELVLGQVLQDIIPQDVAGDEFGRIRVDGYAGVVRKLFLLVKLLEGHAFRRDGSDHARGHHVIGLDIVQLDDVLDDLVFGIVDDAFLFTHVGHGRDLFPGNAGVRLIAGQGAADLLHQPDHGIQDDHQTLHDAGEPGQALPVVGSDGFRDDFGEDQDQQRHDGGNEAEPLAAEQEAGLLADAGGADRIGDGVQGKDGGQGAVRIVLELHEQDGVPVPLVFFHREVGDRGGQQGGFQQGTQEGNRHRPEKKYEQQCHTLSPNNLQI